MPFTFDQPALLSLLLLAVPVVWLGVRSLVVLEPARRVTAIVLRVLVLTLLVLILAGLSTQRTHDDLTVIAVVDRSASVRTFGDFAPRNGTTSDPDQAVLAFVERAGTDRRPDDRFGLVTYDARPSVRVRPGPRDTLEAATIDAPLSGTDTAAALTHALAAVADADTALRLVLVTDGNDTSGDLLSAARAAAAAGVSIDVVPVPYRVGDEVMVEGVYAPAEAREGQTVSVRVVLRGTAPVAGTIELLRDDAVLDLDPAPDRTGVPIQPSQWVARDETGTAGGDDDTDNRYVLAVTLDVPMTAAGPTSFTAVFEPARLDRNQPDLAVNNKAQGFTQVAGKGKLLFVDQLGGASGRILPDALRTRGMGLELIEPDAFPTSLNQLQRYDAVVFQNVPADDIRPSQQDLLVRYVRDLGGGFVMVGGPDSFGAGGWTNTAIDDDLLPVDCEIPSQTILPTGALVICLDRSGSMAIPVGSTGKTQIELAGEAAILALQSLYPQDLVGLIAFDDSPKWIVPLQENNNPGEVARLIRSIQPSGGTNIYTGLERAYRALSDRQFADTAVRHCILLTDGNEPAQNYPQLMNQFARAGITLTTVGVGDMQNTQLLQDLAFLGGGSFYPIADPNQLPKVFIKEARTIRKNLIKESTFVPQRVNTGSPITAGITFGEPLRGIVLTGPRLERRVDMPLVGEEGEPLFAHGQVGLGRVAAFTSDATNRWAVPWLTWSGYGDFWTRTMRTVARPTASRNADLITSFDGDELKLTLNAYDDAGGTSTNPATTGATTVRGGVLTPNGTIEEVTLRQTGPGRYETRLPAPDDGNYIASLYLTDDAGERSAVFGGKSRAPGQELRTFRPDHEKLARVAELTGGRVLDLDAPEAEPLFARTEPFTTVSTRPLRWSLLPWLLALLLLDVANRRIAWDAAAIAGWVRSHVKPSRDDAKQRETLAALKSRKAKAQQGAADSPSDAKPPPVTPALTSAPDRRRKFVTTNDAPANDDFAEAVGGATQTPRKTAAAEPSEEQTDTASTTSRLLAAKRRANEDQ